MVRTAGYIKRTDLGDNPECGDYTPIEYLVFHRAMKVVAHSSGTQSFVDYGSGMVRLVIVSHMYRDRTQGSALI
jgi:hypothetical protein